MKRFFVTLLDLGLAVIVAAPAFCQERKGYGRQEFGDQDWACPSDVW